jgi:hypothetical protein
MPRDGWRLNIDRGSHETNTQLRSAPWASGRALREDGWRDCHHGQFLEVGERDES